jgi:hypothetical protein
MTRGVQRPAEVGTSAPSLLLPLLRFFVSFFHSSFSLSFPEQADHTRRTVRPILSWTTGTVDLRSNLTEFLLSCVATGWRWGDRPSKETCQTSRISIMSEVTSALERIAQLNWRTMRWDEMKEVAEREGRKYHPGIRSDSRRRTVDTQSPSPYTNPRPSDYDA